MKIILLASLILVASCSLFDSAREGVSGEGSARRSMKVVSQAQYDDLMEKYKKLRSDYELLKERRPIRPSTLSEEMTSPTPSMPSVETVDVFKNLPPQVPTVMAEGEIATELAKYQEGMKLKIAAQRDQAMKIFKQLENSSFNQIRVRARYRQAEILMELSEFDLALQAFDSVMSTESYSSLSIDALKNAAICAEKLGSPDKRDFYLSTLRDVFGLSV